MKTGTVQAAEAEKQENLKDLYLYRYVRKRGKNMNKELQKLLKQINDKKMRSRAL